MSWYYIGAGDYIWIETDVEYKERMKNEELEKQIKVEIGRAERQIEYLQEMLEEEKENVPESEQTIVEEGSDIENSKEGESDKENGKQP